MEGPSGDKRLCLPGGHSHQPKGPAKLPTCGLTQSPGHLFRPSCAQCGLWKAGFYLEARIRLEA